MSDLISREALKKELSKRLWFVSSPETDAQAIKDIIDNAPAVEEKSYAMGYQDGLEDGLEDIRPQGDWIPVSDRLPEYSGLYLISIYDLVTVANFTGEYFCDRQMDKFVDVFAWQPLPEPYKKGGAE